jgi:hypothetical protein
MLCFAVPGQILWSDCGTVAAVSALERRGSTPCPLVCFHDIIEEAATRWCLEAPYIRHRAVKMQPQQGTDHPYSFPLPARRLNVHLAAYRADKLPWRTIPLSSACILYLEPTPRPSVGASLQPTSRPSVGAHLQPTSRPSVGAHLQPTSRPSVGAHLQPTFRTTRWCSSAA